MAEQLVEYFEKTEENKYCWFNVNLKYNQDL